MGIQIGEKPETQLLYSQPEKFIAQIVFYLQSQGIKTIKAYFEGQEMLQHLSAIQQAHPDLVGGYLSSMIKVFVSVVQNTNMMMKLAWDFPEQQMRYLVEASPQLVIAAKFPLTDDGGIREDSATIPMRMDRRGIASFVVFIEAALEGNIYGMSIKVGPLSEG